MVTTSLLARNGWLLVAFAGASAMLSLVFFPLHVEFHSFTIPLVVGFFMFCLWQFYRFKRPDPAISALAESATFLIVIMPLLAIVNYATTMAGRPLLDETLAHIDARMGFDWMAHLAWVKTWPGLGTVLTLAYGSSLPQFILAIIILAYTSRLRTLHDFILLFVVTLFTILLLSALFPASGAYPYYAPPADMAVGFNPRNGIWHMAQFTGLRDGTMTTLDLAKVEGIVTFPSFHTVLAVLTAWALRDVKYFAVPVALLNALVIVSTLSIGGHHLIDIIAGAAIAAIGIVSFKSREWLSSAGTQRAATPA